MKKPPAGTNPARDFFVVIIKRYPKKSRESNSRVKFRLGQPLIYPKKKQKTGKELPV